MAAIECSMKGLVKKEELKPVTVKAGYEKYMINFGVYYQDSLFSEDGLRPFFYTKQINTNTVAIQLSTIWPDLASSKQQQFEKMALEWWVDANNGELNQKEYCIEYYLGNKLINKLCSKT